MKERKAQTIVLAGGWLLVSITVLLGSLAFLQPATQRLALSGIALTAGVSSIVIIAMAAYKLTLGRDRQVRSLPKGPSAIPYAGSTPMSKKRVRLAVLGYLLMASAFLAMLGIGSVAPAIRVLLISAMLSGLIMVIVAMRS